MTDTIKVIPLTEEPGTDMYWHPWAVLTIYGTDPEDRKLQDKLEKLVDAVPLEEPDLGEDEDENLDTYFEALKVKFEDAGYEVKLELASMAFPRV